MGASMDPGAVSDHPRLLVDSRFYAVMLLAAASTLSVAVVSPTLPTMATALGVSDARIGLVMTAITLPPMVLAPVVGIASDLSGRRTVVLPAIGLFGAAGLAIGLVDDFLVILGLRVLQGVAMAGLAPVAVTLLGDFYRGPTATTAQGFRTSIAGFGLSAVPLLAGWLAGIGWQFPFVLYAAAFPVGLAIYWYVPETAERVDGTDRIRDALVGYARSVRMELADPRLLVLLWGGFVRFFALFAFLTFVPIFAVRALDATTFEAGIVVAIAGVRVLVSPTAGRWVDRLGRRRSLLAALACVVIAFGLLPLSPNVLVLGALAALFGTGDAILSPVVNDAVTASVRAENRNGVVSALRVLKEAGKTVAPVALGVVLALFGLSALFYAVAAVIAGYLVVVLLQF